MSPALVLLLLLSAGQHGDRGTLGCWTSCQRHVQDAALRARVCQLCVTTGRPDSWVLELSRAKPAPLAALALRSALMDPDWRVRWGALRARAKAGGLTERRVLADWVAEAPAQEEVLACLTAARAAAADGQSTAAFLTDAGSRGGAAAARVWGRRETIRETLELEMYAEVPAVRREALAHLATFLGKPPARVVLEAMTGRPDVVDPVVASALLSVAEKQGTSVGRMLLQVARPTDEAFINRLFLVYSKDVEALQKGLSASDSQERRAAVLSLRRYGPLARRELARALGDTDGSIRRVAARGLAEADGLSLKEAASRGLREEGATLASRRVWLEAAATERGCEPFLLEVARDARLPADTRGEAVGWLAECDGVRLRAQVLAPFLQDAQPLVRAGAVRALVVPRSSEGDAALAVALGDSAPEVVAAALEVVGLQQQRQQGEAVVVQLGSEHPGVREAAARALERLGRPQDVKPLAETLRTDSVASVRVVAAQALATLGGPIAASALSQALSKDPDSHVQHVARRGLERLGFRPP